MIKVNEQLIPESQIEIIEKTADGWVVHMEGLRSIPTWAEPSRQVFTEGDQGRYKAYWVHVERDSHRLTDLAMVGWSVDVGLLSGQVVGIPRPVTLNPSVSCVVHDTVTGRGRWYPDWYDTFQEAVDLVVGSARAKMD